MSSSVVWSNKKRNLHIIIGLRPGQPNLKLIGGGAYEAYFSSIKNDLIFEPDFLGLSPGSETIEFKKNKPAAGGIAVVYAPNGTGKSSLAEVLGAEKTTPDLNFSVKNENGCVSGIYILRYTNGAVVGSGSFHIIQEHNYRNHIRGRETDYLIGDQISRYKFRLKRPPFTVLRLHLVLVRW